MAQLLENTLMGGALILAAAGLRRLLRGRVPPDGWLALWAVCLARLLTPVPWRSPLSLYALLGRPAGAAEPASVPLEPAPVPGAAGAALAPPISSAASQPPSAGPSPLAALWAAAALGLAVWFLAAWLSARRRVRRTIPLEKSDRRYAALPAGTALREGPMKGAPLTFGVVRPAVVLPPGLKAPELDCALAHEGAHVRRRDNLWHYAMAAALVLHWFNPAVWLMAGLLRRDVEMACDRAALRELGTERRAEYAQALVTLSTQAGGSAFCHGFGPKKRAEERITAIMKFKKTTFAGAALALALALGLTVVFASGPETPGADASTGKANSCEAPPADVLLEEQGFIHADGSIDPQRAAAAVAREVDLPATELKSEYGKIELVGNHGGMTPVSGDLILSKSLSGCETTRGSGTAGFRLTSARPYFRVYVSNTGADTLHVSMSYGSKNGAAFRNYTVEPGAGFTAVLKANRFGAFYLDFADNPTGARLSGDVAVRVTSNLTDFG